MVRAIIAALAIALSPCHAHSSETYAPTYAPTAAPTYAPTAAPSATTNLVELALVANALSREFDILIAAVVKAGLVETLSGTDVFTVFAPTDDAFEALNITTDYVDTADDDTVAALKTILLYHTLSGEFTAADVVASSSLTTVEGDDIEVDGTVLNGDVNIVTTDLFASNGVIHVIDGVLIPPSLA